MKRRVFWIVSYVVSELVTLQFSGFGHGSYAPYGVFYSWGALPWLLASDRHKTYLNFFGAPGIYWACLFLAFRFLPRQHVSTGTLLVFFGHVLGVVVAAGLLEREHLATGGLIPGSYPISIGLIGLFFSLAYRLERRETQARAYS